MRSKPPSTLPAQNSVFKIIVPRTRPLHLRMSTSRRYYKVKVILGQLKIVKLQPGLGSPDGRRRSPPNRLPPRLRRFDCRETFRDQAHFVDCRRQGKSATPRIAPASQLAHSRSGDMREAGTERWPTLSDFCCFRHPPLGTCFGHSGPMAENCGNRSNVGRPKLWAVSSPQSDCVLPN